MIDRTELTEAREWVVAYAKQQHLPVLVEALDKLLDFPTDQQVWANQRAFDDEGGGENGLLAGLVAVRDSMIGEDKMPDGRPWMDEGERTMIGDNQ